MESNYNGLTSKEAQDRLKRDGYNIIHQEKSPNKVILFLKEFKDPMILILIASSLISFLLKEYIDSFIILFVVLLNSIISFVQEVKAYKALSSLKKLSSPKCLIKRDNKELYISSQEVVEGDLLILEEGSIIPADAKLIKINHLLVDESSLTGESFPVEKKFVSNSETYRLDYVYASSEVLEGKAEAIITKTGKNTEIGKIALVASKKKEQTPLEKRLDKLGFQLGIITIVICLIIFIFSYLKGGKLMETFITSISLGVAAIPEGLPSVVTITLSLGVMKMVKKKVIVSKLPSVETLGSISLICSDKTGTLTQNIMEVEEAYFDKYVTNFSSYKKEIFYFLLCSSVNKEKGSPTEKAIYNLGEKIGIIKEKIDEMYPKIDELPFSSTNKYMETTHIIDSKKIKIIKGAPEIVLAKCNYKNINNPIFFDNKQKELVIKDISVLTKKALRLIACAISVEDKIIFVGVLGLRDPLRKEAPLSVERMLKAGVKVKMITGDHKDTAFEIAKKSGIAKLESEVMEGKEIDSLSEKEFMKRIKNTTVFARVSPLHKLKIVKAYQKLDEIVAMTGDGVNDAPSLKMAHVGIAMGKGGKEVAKEASDIIIQDDNFSTIVDALEEGRNIYANIRKAVLFLLSSNIAEVLVMVSGLFFSIPLPLLAIHILFINLISDSLPALALGLDKKEEDVMKEVPRKQKDTLFSKDGMFILFFYSLLIFFLTIFSFLLPPCLYLYNLDLPINIENIQFAILVDEVLMKSRTIAFSTLSLCELFHMISMSSINHSLVHILKKKNWLLIITFIVGVILQILITTVPILTTIFKTTPLNFVEWIIIFLLSMTPLLMHEIFKKKTNH